MGRKRKAAKKVGKVIGKNIIAAGKGTQVLAKKIGKAQKDYQKHQLATRKRKVKRAKQSASYYRSLTKAEKERQKYQRLVRKRQSSIL